MKRMTYFVMALALVLGFTQCKKEQIEPQNQDGKVRIAVNVKKGASTGSATDGSKVNVTDNHVTFEKGDQILVGYHEAYVGTLTHNGTRFEGDVYITEGDPDHLYFYFVGNKPVSLSVGEQSCTVNISDQTDELPVLSFGRTEDYFNENISQYTASLDNQCALVRFPLRNDAISAKISGMHTEATIDFTSFAYPITPNGTTGDVKLYSKSHTEKWAILLPQDPVSAQIQGVTVDVPAITANAYITSIPTIENPPMEIDLSTLQYWWEEETVLQDGAIIYGELNEPCQLSIADGATVMMRDATITGDLNIDEWGYSAGITCQGDATIILEGTNTVRGLRSDEPGIKVGPSGTTLTIMGTGSLTVGTRNGSRGAGIGSAGSGSCGNIVIKGGSIYATGGSGSAAIGCAEDGTCGTITITDGVTLVEATKGYDSPCCVGIGNYSSYCGTVTIGGTVYWDGYDYQNGGNTYLTSSPLVYSNSSPTPSDGIGSLVYDSENHPIAMVAYVGDDYTLAIKLSDWVVFTDPESDPITEMSWNYANNTIQSWNDFTGETWRLPTVEEWQNMIVACGGSQEGSSWYCDGLKTKLEAVGGVFFTNYADYWTSTEETCMNSYYNDWEEHYVANFWPSMNQECCVRPVLQIGGTMPVVETPDVTWNINNDFSCPYELYSISANLTVGDHSGQASWDHTRLQLRSGVTYGDPNDTFYPSSLTFSSLIWYRKITKIVITHGGYPIGEIPSGWSNDGTKLTWEGTPAESVTMMSSNSNSDSFIIFDPSKVEFYLLEVDE